MIVCPVEKFSSRETSFNSITSQAWSSLLSGCYGKLEVVHWYLGDISTVLVHVVLTGMLLCRNRLLQLFAGLLCCLKCIGRKKIAPNNTFSEAIYFTVMSKALQFEVCKSLSSFGNPLLLPYQMVYWSVFLLTN